MYFYFSATEKVSMQFRYPTDFLKFAWFGNGDLLGQTLNFNFGLEAIHYRNYGLLATTDQSFVSNITPKGSTVNNLVLKCSIVNNNTTNQSDIIDVFSIGAATGGATFGGNLNYANDIEKWVRITPGTYNSIIITIVDENMQDIAILDNNLLINFLIKTP
jgi:hypothetical protein